MVSFERVKVLSPLCLSQGPYSLETSNWPSTTISLKVIQMTYVMFLVWLKLLGLFQTWERKCLWKTTGLKMGNIPQFPDSTLGWLTTSLLTPCSLSHQHMKGELLSQHLRNPLFEKRAYSLWRIKAKLQFWMICLQPGAGSAGVSSGTNANLSQSITTFKLFFPKHLKLSLPKQFRNLTHVTWVTQCAFQPMTSFLILSK